MDFDSKSATEHHLFSTPSVSRGGKKEMPRNFYLPFSLFIKVQVINVLSSKGRRFSGQKDNKLSAEMS